MKKIDRILKYNFNRKERRFLRAQWYINWCGWKWGFSFSKIMTGIIESLKWFKREFYRQLLIDLEILCWEHDIDFTLGGTKWDFRKANFRFAYKVYKITSWAKWLSFFKRIWLAILIYKLLNKNWKEYFNFKEKIEIEDLFTNYNP